MKRDGSDVSVNEKEVRELLSILQALFGVRAGYFYLSEKKRWTALIDWSEHYCAYCRAVRKQRSAKCEGSNTDFFAKGRALGKALWYQCYNGLHELYVPLELESHDAGFLHVAQVRTEKPYRQVARECGLAGHPDYEKLREAYEAMPVFDEKKRELIARVATLFAERITMKRLVELRRAEPARLLELYVDQHLDRDPSIEGAARFMDKSPSWVTHTFRKVHRLPFREYVAQRRIERARRHLAMKSIAETAALCGFKNRYHFTRVFTRLAGMTPAAFLRTLREGKA